MRLFRGADCGAGFDGAKRGVWRQEDVGIITQGVHGRRRLRVPSSYGTILVTVFALLPAVVVVVVLLWWWSWLIIYSPIPHTHRTTFSTGPPTKFREGLRFRYILLHIVVRVHFLRNAKQRDQRILRGYTLEFVWLFFCFSSKVIIIIIFLLYSSTSNNHGGCNIIPSGGCSV